MSLDTAAPPTPVDTKVSGGEAASTEAVSATQSSGHAKTGSTSAAAAPTAAATSSPNPAAGNSGSNAGQQLTLRALVTSREAGIIIGKAGKNVADLREATGVRAGVSKVVPGVPDRVLTVTGTPEGIIKAYGSILRNLAENAATQGEAGAEQSSSGSNSVLRLLVANAIMGGIIGKAGANIQAMQQKYSSKIVTVKEMLPSSTERIVSVEGTLSAVEGTVGELTRIVSEQDSSRLQGNVLYQPGAHAANPIAAVGAAGPNVGPIAAGGGAAAFGGGQAMFGGQPFRAGPYSNSGPRRQQNGGHQQRGFRGNGNEAPAHSSQAVPTPSNPELRTQNISIPADMVGCIIGRGGSKINEIRTSSGARISIAKTAHDETGERMFTITGPSTSLEKALFMLYSQLEAEKEKRIQNQQNAMAEGQ